MNEYTPTTAREALALAWELAYPVKEGQVIPEGTWLIKRRNNEIIVGKNNYFNITASEWDAENRRTLDPRPEPEPEPDWLDAPAVFAHCDYCSQGDYGPQITLHGSVFNGQKWECAECKTTTDWSNLRDVTPLYPKETL